MSNSYAITVERAAAVDTPVNGGFGNKATRSASDSSFAVGMILQIPAKEDRKVFANKQLSNERVKALYFICPVINENGDIVDAIPCYPSMFNRRVRIWEKSEDGQLVNTQAQAAVSGKPAEDFASVALVDDALDLLAEHKGGKITDIKRVPTRNYERTDLTETTIMSFEYVD